MKKYFVFIGLVVSFMGLYAQNGTLDPTFNSKGWKSFYFGDQGNIDNEYGYDVLQQKDGKYIVDMYVEQSGNTILMRLNSNGTIDKTYGIDGFSMPIYFYVDGAIIQKDDKVVAGGHGWNNGNIILMAARFKADGNPDSTFGVNGVAISCEYDYTDPYTYLNSLDVIVDSSSRVIITGSFNMYHLDTYQYTGQWFVSRLTAEGLPDTDFNAGATLTGTTTVDFNNYSTLNALAVQSDGKLLLGGASLGSYSNNNFTVVRMISDGEHSGTLDASFGNGGITVTSLENASDIAGLTVQSDQKILATGYALRLIEGTDATAYQFALTRYLTDGTPDPTFNAGSTVTGTVFTFMGSDAWGLSVSTNNDKILVTGFKETYVPDLQYSVDSIAVAVYTTNGTLDNSFGSGGKAITAFSANDQAVSGLLQSNGAVVISGTTYDSTAQNTDLLIIRYTSTGNLDQTFNAAGSHPGMANLYHIAGANCMITTAAVQPDGKIVVAGSAQQFDADKIETDVFCVARFNPDGKLDSSFGTNGYAFANFGNGTWAWGYSLAISPVGAPNAGKIVVGGYLEWWDNNGNYEDFILAQFTSAGVLDNSFDGDGMLLSDLGPNDNRLLSLAIQPDGKIVAGGLSNNNSSRQLDDFLLARYTSAGALDATFGSTGTVTVDFMGEEDDLVALALQPDGKIVASGAAFDPNTSYTGFALVRLNTNGTLDRRFGNNGKVTTAFTDAYGVANSLAFQGDGKIVIGGNIVIPNQDTSYLAVARYSSAGALDRTFASGGVASVSFTGYDPINDFYYHYGASVALQSDGKILLATPVQPSGGISLQQETRPYYSFGVSRLTTTGSIDNTWGNSGYLVGDFPGDVYLHSALWNNGRLYALANYYTINSNSASFIAAYTAGQGKPLPPSITIQDMQVTEGATATLTVLMDKTSTSPITVNFATKDNTATSKGKNPDYRSVKGSITFVPGTTTATISVITRTDTTTEGPETFFVDLSLSSQMAKLATLADNEAVVTINDGLPVAMPDVLDELTRLNNQGKEVNTKLAAKVLPNPSTTLFTLELQGAANTPVSLRVMDISGRLVETKTSLPANSRIQLGHNYTPGVYYAELTQGKEKVIVKMVKQ